MYRGDLARDGHPSTATLDATAAGRLRLTWRAHLDGAVDGTPAIGRGLVVAGSAGGELVALNAATGERVWTRHGLGAISDSPTISGDRVFVGSLTGRLYAMSLLHGDAIWNWKGPAGSAIWASPVAYGGELIVGVASPYGDKPFVPGRLYGLDAANGHQRWSMCVQVNCEPGGGIWSTPAIDEAGTAFVGVGNPVDGVMAFDPLTGRQKWMASLYADVNRDLDVGASPVVFKMNGEEVVAQASLEGTFALIDAVNRTVVWSHALVRGSAVHGLIASPAFDGTALYVGSASPPTGVFALRPSDGTVMWRHDTEQPVYSAPAVGNGVVVFGAGAVFGDLKSGSVLALSGEDGHVLWSYNTGSAVRSGPAIAGDLLVVGDSGGDVMAFRPKP
jgi:outer membrane protein assembly factor BamB